MIENTDIIEAIINQASADGTSSVPALGADFLTLPAVLVPPGGVPPAGDWVLLGTASLPVRRQASDQDEQAPA